MGGMPNDIYRQLKLGDRPPVTAETTPIIEEHQTTIKIPRIINAELDLQKGDKIFLRVESPTRITVEIVKGKK